MFSFYVLQISVIDVQNRDIDSNPSFFKDLEVEGIYILYIHMYTSCLVYINLLILYNVFIDTTISKVQFTIIP